MHMWVWVDEWITLDYFHVQKEQDGGGKGKTEGRHIIHFCVQELMKRTNERTPSPQSFSKNFDFLVCFLSNLKARKNQDELLHFCLKRNGSKMKKCNTNEMKQMLIWKTPWLFTFEIQLMLISCLFLEALRCCPLGCCFNTCRGACFWITSGELDSFFVSVDVAFLLALLEHEFMISHSAHSSASSLWGTSYASSVCCCCFMTKLGCLLAKQKMIRAELEPESTEAVVFFGQSKSWLSYWKRERKRKR